MRYSLCFIVPTLLFASCDKMSTLNYKVTNISSDSVKIVSVKKDGSILKADTFWLGYNRQITIASVDKGFEHISKYKETAPALTDFQSISVYRLHSAQPSATSFLSTGRWSYSEKSSHMADYTTTITDSDF